MSHDLDVSAWVSAWDELMLLTTDLYCVCRMLLKPTMSNILVFFGGNAHRFDIECMLENIAAMHNSVDPDDPLIQHVERRTYARSGSPAIKFLMEIHNNISDAFGLKNAHNRNILTNIKEDSEDSDTDGEDDEESD